MSNQRRLTRLEILDLCETVRKLESIQSDDTGLISVAEDGIHVFKQELHEIASEFSLPIYERATEGTKYEYVILNGVTIFALVV